MIELEKKFVVVMKNSRGQHWAQSEYKDLGEAHKAAEQIKLDYLAKGWDVVDSFVISEKDCFKVVVSRSPFTWEMAKRL